MRVKRYSCQNFLTLRQQITSKHEQLIEEEKVTLDAEILQLKNEIATSKTHFEDRFRIEIEVLRQKLDSLLTSTGINLIQRFINYIKRRSLKRELLDYEHSIDSKVRYAIGNLVDQHNDKIDRHKYITSQFKDAVKESYLTEMSNLENKHRVIDEIKNSIYGALGEHKVVKELQNLSDENVLINDFTLSFYPAIYNRQENDYIKSIQIDHLLVTPSGIFLIETKNWSVNSLTSLDLRSPVQQVKRTNFALFKILARDISNDRVILKQHHWGDRRIPIKNLIVLTNSKPNEEFQHVKILTVNELLNYIKYFKPVFTDIETQVIASYFLNLNETKS